MKRWTALLLALCMLMSLFGVTASASNLEEEEIKIHCTVDGNVATVSGDGYLRASIFNSVEDKSAITTVVIGQGVITVSNEAFDVLPNLERVEADTTTYMYGVEVTKFKTDERGVLYEYDSTFDYESGVATSFPYQLVWMPDSISGSYTVPDSVTSIAEDFSGCSQLTELIFGAGADGPHSVYAFRGCTSLQTVKVGGHEDDDYSYLVNGDRGEVFMFAPGSGLKGLVFVPVGVTSYTVPADVTTITSYAALVNPALTEIQVAQGNTQYQSVDGVLYSADGKTLCAYPNSRPGDSYTIPAEVKEIENYAFANSNLKEIVFEGTYPSMGSETFEGVKATCYYPADDEIWPLVIQESGYLGNSFGGDITWVAGIGEGGGAEEPIGGSCGENLTWSLDGDVLTISGTGPMEDYSVRLGTFAGWHDYNDEIKAVVVEEGVTTIGDCAFHQCQMESIDLPDSITSIGTDAFLFCGYLTSVAIPEGVTTIGCTFNYCGVKNVVIPDSVTSIEDSAFNDCLLESVTIPASVTYIGSWAFAQCFYMTEVTFQGDAPEMVSVTEGGSVIYPFTGVKATAYYPAGNETWTEEAMAGCGGKLTWIPYVPGSIASGTCGDKLTWSLDENGVLTISGTGEMYDFEEGQTPWSDNQSDITAVVIESGVTSIGNSAFMGCASLKEATIPDTVTYIGNFAFSDSGLTAVVMPDSVTETGFSVFSHCRDLESAVLSANLEVINSYLFFMSGLKSVEIPDGVISIGYQTFAYSGITEIEIPDSVEFIGERALAGIGCTSIHLPANLTLIPEGMMEGCGGLTELEIPAAVESIGAWAFAGCVGLKQVDFLGDAPVIGENAFTGNSEVGRPEFTAYYPAGNATWTEDVMQNYGEGSITWVAREAVKLGDANGDGNINNVDAMLILQYAVGLLDESKLNLTACNVNGDGNVNNVDAMLVLQFAVGLITEFTSGK